jgi:hypothetical protein
MRSLLMTVAAGVAGISALAHGQVAVLANGTVLQQKVPLEIWATEAPLWDIDIAAKTLTAIGQVVTVPASINGVPFSIEGTDRISANGAQLGPIGVDQFDRMSDTFAVTRDAVFLSPCPTCGPWRLGPVRSIFSTSEARSAAVGLLDRDPNAQRLIEDNFFRIALNCFLAHRQVLPADFLGRIGIRNAQGQYPTNPFQLPPRTYWRYPHNSGGTLKSAGTIYVDPQGNEYRIPDAGLVVELAENVTIGRIRSFQAGSATLPPSFVVNDALVILNPDPRIMMHAIGVGGATISPEVLVEALGNGVEVSVVGYMVSDHVLFGIELEIADYWHPSMGIVVSADRFSARADRGDLRWRGILAPPEGKTLWAVIGKQEFAVPFIVDPATGVGQYDMRLEDLDLVTHTTLDMVVRDAETGEELHRETFDFAEFIQADEDA